MECRIRTTYLSAFIHFHCQHERLPSPPKTHTTIHPRQHDSKSFLTYSQDIFQTIIYIASTSDYPFGGECWQPFSWWRSRIFTICSPSGKNQPGYKGCSKCWYGRKLRTGISRLPSSSITGKKYFWRILTII